jgi:predicted nucleotidyltransferase
VTKEDIKRTLRANREKLKIYHVRRIGLFGSQARGVSRARSDIDLLVEFDEPIDLFAFVHLADDIENILHNKVDLATEKSLKPFIRSRVMKEVEWIEGL